MEPTTVEAIAMVPANTSVQTLVLWAVAVSQLLTVALTIWNLMSSGNRANAKKLEDHDRSLSSHDQRLIALEHDRAAMPTQKDFHELEVSMAQVQGSMAVLAERLKPLESISERLQEWMMEMGRK